MIVYVPDVVFGAKVKIPLASILNGPVVIGVTSVLAVVTATPFRVSLIVTSPTVVAVEVLGVCVGKVVSSIASIGFNTTTVAVAVSQFDGFAPVSHN